MSNRLADTACRTRDNCRSAFETEPRAVSNFFVFGFENFDRVARFDFGDGFFFDVNGAFEQLTRAAIELDRDVSEVHQIFLDFATNFDDLEFRAADFVNVAGFDHAG